VSEMQFRYSWLIRCWPVLLFLGWLAVFYGIELKGLNLSFAWSAESTSEEREETTRFLAILIIIGASFGYLQLASLSLSDVTLGDKGLRFDRPTSQNSSFVPWEEVDGIQVQDRLVDWRQGPYGHATVTLKDGRRYVVDRHIRLAGRSGVVRELLDEISRRTGLPIEDCTGGRSRI